MSDEATDKASKKRERSRRRRRRLLLFVGIVVMLAMGARAAVDLLLPTVLRKVAASYGLTCSYERSDLNLLSGDADLWHLSFSPKVGGPPVLSLGYVSGNISTLALLRGQLNIWRVEADGVDVFLKRNADGSMPLLDSFLASKRKTASSGPAPTATSRNIDLTPPLKLDAFRLSHLRVHIEDDSVEPVYKGTFTMNVRVSDLGSPIRPITFALDLWGEPALDLLRVEGKGNASGRNLDASVRFTLRGLRLVPMRSYLEQAGFRPLGQTISAQASGKLQLQPCTAPSKAICGSLVLHDAYLGTDAAEAAACKRIEVNADSIDFDRASIAQVLVEGVRFNTAASKDRALRFGGVELATAAGNRPTTRPMARAGTDQSAPATRPLMPFNYPISIARLKVRDVRTTFDDHSVTPAARLAFDVDDFTVRNIVTNPQQHANVVTLAARMHAPGVAKAIRVDGQVCPFARKKTLHLSMSADGLVPHALAPYLQSAGLESQLHAGQFTADIDGEVMKQPDGRTIADAHITKLRFADGATDLLAMNDVQMRGAGYDAKSGLMQIDSIDISGPGIHVHRDEAGRLSVLGLRTIKRSVDPPHATFDTPPAPKEDHEIAVPRIRLGRFTWKDLSLHFEDDAVSPPSNVGIADAGVEITDLLIGSSAKADQVKPGKLKAWLSAPGLIKSALIEGAIASKPHGMSVDVHLGATGISADALKPYLKSLGLEPDLHDGRAQAHAEISLSSVGNGLAASLALNDVRYLDGQTELAAVDRVRVSDVLLSPDELSIGAVQIDSPRASISRDAHGLLCAGGIKLASTTQPVPETEPAPATPRPATAPVGLPFVAVLKQFQLNNAALNWSDGFVRGGVHSSAAVSAELENLTVGRKAGPAPFKFTLSVPGSVGQLQAAGHLITSPNTEGIDMQVTGRGIRAGVLQRYLPPGIGVSLHDGQVQASVSAAISKNPEGGHSAKLMVQSVNFSDNVGGNPTPLLKLGDFSVVASRIDPPAVITIDKVALVGLETDIHQDADGVTHALGVTLSSAPLAPESREIAPPATAVAATGSAVPSTMQLVAAGRRPPPHITLNKLDLNVSRISVHNDASPDAKPLTLANLDVHNVGPIDLGGPNAESQPPATIQIAGRIDPVIGRFVVDMQLSPFAHQPSASVDLTATGIRGNGLTELFPSLKDRIDGSAMTDGRFHSHLQLHGQFRRRGPAGPDFKDPFDLRLTVRGTEFRNSPDSPILAGLESLHADAIHVNPETSGVRIKTLELTKPIGNVWRDPKGIHALGLTLKLPSSTTQPAVSQPAEAQRVRPSQPIESGRQQASGEFRIDRLLVSGLDFHFEDRAVQPPMIVPLNGLDVEVRNLSNRSLTEDRPIRFSALVTSGTSPLPSVKPGASETAIDSRELFSQIAANGNVSLYPELRGYTRASINGFELVSLRGLAHEQQVTLGKGVFDGTFDLRFPGDGTIDTQSKLVFTDLKVSEPPNGIIQRTLKLPGTLDVAINALQDADGSITVPLNVSVKQGQLTGGAIASAAVGAIASVVTTAVASAPVKLAGGIGDILTGARKASSGQETVILAFDPGVSDLSDQARHTLDRLVVRLRKDKNAQLILRNALSQADLGRVELRANPDREACEHLAYQLHNRKMDLLARRAELAGVVQGIIASSASADRVSDAVARLCAVDREIAQNADALDRVYDLLSPGAQHQAARRTRAASLALARDRANAIRDFLLSGNVPEVTERVHSVNPSATASSPNEGGGTVLATLITKKKG